MHHAEQIKVRVHHSDPLVREGLIAAFSRYGDFDVLPAVGSEAEREHVVVADYDGAMSLLQDHGSAAGARRLRVVIIGGIDREWEVRHAVESGVHGYLLPGASVATIVDGVRASARGQRWFSPQAATRLAESMSGDALTDRETDVMRLVAEGLCNKAIGRRLGIALGTVKSHLKSSFDKLGVASRTQAAAAIERRGLLEDPSRKTESLLAEDSGPTSASAAFRFKLVTGVSALLDVRQEALA